MLLVPFYMEHSFAVTLSKNDLKNPSIKIRTLGNLQESNALLYLISSLSVNSLWSDLNLKVPLKKIALQSYEFFYFFIFFIWLDVPHLTYKHSVQDCITS